MMKRRIFIWVWLLTLIVTFSLCREVLAEQYVIKRGDTLAKIAKNHGIKIDSLRKANGITGSAIKPGHVLVIPQSAKTATNKQIKAATKPASYVVKKGDTLQKIAAKTGSSVSDITRINNVNPRNLKVGQRLELAKSKTNITREDRTRNDQVADELEFELEDDGELLTGNEAFAEPDTHQGTMSGFLGEWNSPHERSLIVKVSKGFLGTPYRLGGSSVRGVDCSAFVKKLYHFFDISLPRTAREQARVGKNVSREELEEGDLVFFNTRRAFGHVGIYIGNNEFVHASSGRERKVRIDTLDKPYFDKRFVKAVRIMDLKDEGDDI